MHSYTQTCPIHPRTLRVDRLRPGTARWLCRPQMIVPMQCHAGMPVECPQLRWQGCGPGPHPCQRSSRLPGGSPVPPRAVHGTAHWWGKAPIPVQEKQRRDPPTPVNVSPTPTPNGSHAVGVAVVGGTHRRRPATPIKQRGMRLPSPIRRACRCSAWQDGVDARHAHVV